MSPSPVHPAVAWAAAMLDDASDEWCVLRGDLTLERRGADIDILASAPALRLIEDRLAEEGALVLRRGSAEPVTFIVHRSGDWLKLDVATRLRIRSLREVPPDVVAACLSRRARSAGVSRLSPEDEFWALFLHCLLNKRHFPEHAAARLDELAVRATGATELTQWARRVLGRELTPADAVAIARGTSSAGSVGGEGSALRPMARLQRVWAAWNGRVRRIPLRSRTGVIVDLNVSVAELQEALRGYPLPARIVSARAPWGSAIAHYHRLRGRLVVLTDTNKQLLDEAGDGGHVVELGRVLWERHASHIRRHVSNA